MENGKTCAGLECPDEAKPEEFFEAKALIGKEVPHPNTTEHHIRWIQLVFKPDGDEFAYQVGNFEFTAHGESVDGPDTGPVYTKHSVKASMKLKKSGVLYATSFCNIHGLWENEKPIKVT